MKEKSQIEKKAEENWKPSCAHGVFNNPIIK
jgi:hypothetical protein